MEHHSFGNEHVSQLDPEPLSFTLRMTLFSCHEWITRTWKCSPLFFSQTLQCTLLFRNELPERRVCTERVYSWVSLFLFYSRISCRCSWTCTLSFIRKVNNSLWRKSSEFILLVQERPSLRKSLNRRGGKTAMMIWWVYRDFLMRLWSLQFILSVVVITGNEEEQASHYRHSCSKEWDQTHRHVSKSLLYFVCWILLFFGSHAKKASPQLDEQITRKNDPWEQVHGESLFVLYHDARQWSSVDE